MTIISQIIGYLLFAITIGFILFGIVKTIAREMRNERGYRQMEADRKAKGQPYFGQDDEELEKEMYDIWD